MNKTIPAWKSKTVWSSLLVVAAAILQIFGYHFGVDDQAKLIEIFYKVVILVGSMSAIISRIIAKDEIGSIL